MLCIRFPKYFKRNQMNACIYCTAKIVCLFLIAITIMRSLGFKMASFSGAPLPEAPDDIIIELEIGGPMPNEIQEPVRI